MSVEPEDIDAAWDLASEMVASALVDDGLSLAVYDEQPTDPDTYDCWLRRHGDVEVWVVTFERERVLDVTVSTGRWFLARDSSRGYTTDPGHALRVARARYRAHA